VVAGGIREKDDIKLNTIAALGLSHMKDTQK
jgi:hypothetical protein